ncbi:MAG TPA: outer membrane protein assembly factor BamA [Bryobacteraceae bacterium]|nr:outer membrane protein assembly factor BamA [Bryobacteraceae bacterium]
MVAVPALPSNNVWVRAATRLLLVAMVFASAAAGIDLDKYVGETVIDVRFLPPGDTSLADFDRAEAIKAVQIGKPLEPDEVRQLIKDVFATGRFADVRVEAEKVNGGVILNIVTELAWFIRNVTVPGVPDPPNPGQLQNATKLQLGERLYDTQLRQAVENIMQLLRSNGLYRAEVDAHKVELSVAQQVDVVFQVEPGKRARFTRPIVKGNPLMSEDQVIKLTRWKRFFGLLGWRDLTDARLQGGLSRIRNWYLKRNYLRASVSLEQMDYNAESNRVRPVIDVNAGSPVKVTTTGAKLSSGKLRDMVPIFQEQALDKDLLVEGQRNLIRYFQARGYFEAQVDFELRKDDKGHDLVDYAIAPGEKHKLVSVEIRGNHYFNNQTIRERMFTVPASFRFRNGRFSEEYLERDERAIESLYKANGFRDVQVTTTVEDDYQGKPNQVAVIFNIEEGPQWLVENLVLEGVQSQDRPYVEPLIQSMAGQPYSDVTIAADQDAVLNYYYSNGYPDATFEVNVRPGSKPATVSIEYVIRQGQRRYVRDVLVSGLVATNPELVKERIRNLEPGEPLSQVAMNENQRRLYDLGVFARVDTAIQNPDGNTQYKYVQYRVEEAKKYSLNVGFGAQLGRIGRGNVTAYEAPAGSTGFAPRVLFGISRSNFLGLGHTISLQTRFSTIQQRALLTYYAPQFKGHENLSLSVTGIYDDSRDVNTFTARRQEGSVQLSYRLTKANTVQYRIGYRRISLSDVQIIEQLVPLFTQAVQLGFISTTFIQDRRDDPSDATRGIYNTVDLTFASSLLGSQTTFIRGLLRNATYTRVRGRDLIFARSTSFGFLGKLSSADIPLAERFFAGGANSHRGFGENQAGPRDISSRVVLPTGVVFGTGFPIGGRGLLLNTFELRFPLIGDNLGGVVFHDAGNVYSSVNKISFRVNQRNLQDFDYMVHAVGFGFRYRTPIGPVRLDLAYSVNPPRFLGLKGTTEQLLDPNLVGVRQVVQRISRFQFFFSLGQAF